VDKVLIIININKSLHTITCHRVMIMNRLNCILWSCSTIILSKIHQT